MNAYKAETAKVFDLDLWDKPFVVSNHRKKYKKAKRQMAKASRRATKQIKEEADGKE